MTKSKRFATAPFLTLAMLACLSPPAHAAQCGNGPRRLRGLETAVRRRSPREGHQRLDRPGLDGHELSAQATINADRGQRSFSLSLDQFLAKRGASTIVARGRALKQSQAALFASIQARYGVPPGPLLAIWGMESGFGGVRGNQNMLSSIATLAYDCRRPEYFTDQLYAALKLIDRGALSPASAARCMAKSARRQFMPKNMLEFGIGNLERRANALSSTANFLKAHGWKAGAGYQPGEANFAAIEAWNAAGVYPAGDRDDGPADRRRGVGVCRTRSPARRHCEATKPSIRDFRGEWIPPARKMPLIHPLQGMIGRQTTRNRMRPLHTRWCSALSLRHPRACRPLRRRFQRVSLRG